VAFTFYINSTSTMSTEEVQAEAKKFPSIEMVAMEKQSSVEVGEVSVISEEDIGECIWSCFKHRHKPNKTSRCRKRVF
jgi:hypothetical protein